MNFNKNPNRSFDKPSFEGRKEKETLNVQAEFLISQTSDVSPRSRPFQWLVTIPDVGKEKGSLERVGSYCRYKQSEGKQTEEKCVCVYPPIPGAWSTRRRYNLKLCAQKHVTISRLRGTCSVYVRHPLLSFSLSFLLPEQGWKKMAKDRGNDVRFSPRSFSPVYLDLSDL